LLKFSLATGSLRTRHAAKETVAKPKEPENMEHTVETVSAVKRKLTMTVPAAEVNAAINEAVKFFGKGLVMPGFRKGKVPPKVIEKRFAEEVLNRATDKLVNAQIKSVLEQEQLEPVGRVDYDGGQVSRDQDLSFTGTFEVLPEVPLPEDMTALSVEVENPAVTPQEEENFLTRIRRLMATEEEVTEKRLPQDGDVVCIDVEATLDGQRVDSMSAEEYYMRLAAPEEGAEQGKIEELARSLHVGEEKQESTECAADHPDPSVRGKVVDLKVKLRHIKREILPELDDELAKKMGHDSLEAMRQRIFDDMMHRKIRQVRENAQNKLLESVLESRDYALPESLVTSYLGDFIAEAQNSLTRQGLEGEALTNALKGMEDDALKQARLRAKAAVFLMALAKREKLDVSDQEVDMHIMAMARDGNENFTELRERAWENGAAEEIRRGLTTGKALELLYSKAKKIRIDADGNPLPEQEATENAAE